MPSPLWRHAPTRAWRAGGSGVLLVAALTAATASTASVPMFAQLAGASALESTLATIPDDARTSDAAALRRVGGRSPRSEDQQTYLDRLAVIPGLTEPVVTGRSVGPELNYSSLFRPLVRAEGVDVRARLLAVADPTAELVVTSGAARPGAVWLSDPVARELGVRAGGSVSLLVQTSDADHPAPPRSTPPVVATVEVAGTYAVAPDGRRPADPPGTQSWSRRTGWLPTDSDLTTLPAALVVGDVATVDTVANRIGDPLLWSVEARLDPRITLDEARTTAAEVAELRRDVRAPDGTQQSGPLRLGLVSGIEDVVARADGLARATTQRGELLSRAGVSAGLLAALVIAVLMALDRRRELAHGASIGVGPVRTAGLWGLEALVPGAVAVLLGVLLARAALAVGGPGGEVPRTAVVEGVRRASLAALVGVVVIAAVGAVAVVVSERATSTARNRRVPWVPVLVAVAAVAVIATVTAPANSAGPVALAVPALAAAAAGACLSVASSWACRRALGRSSSGLPRAVPAATRWLALRRLARPAPDQPVVVAVTALGLGMVLFALSAVAATQVAVADRVAVASGATTTAQVVGSWALDPTVPQLPTVDQVAKGARIPVGRTPTVPDGMTLVWRSPVSIDGDFGYRDLLVADPAQLAATASWGEGRELADARATLGRLATADRDAVAAGTSSPVPVIAVAEPGFRTGDGLTISGQEWSTPVVVIASIPSFPGARTTGMLVAAGPSFFQAVPRWDPRLAPPDDALSPRAFFETWLWSSRPSAEVTAFLDSRAASATASTTADRSAQEPALVAAERSLGYQVFLAVFLALTALVAVVVHARRLVRRSRGADALLARVGLGRGGVARARAWEVVLVVVVALAAAVAVNLLVGPLGPLLLDLDRGARPPYELHITTGALAATLAVAVGSVLVALLAGVRPMVSRHGPTPEEVVLRDDG